MSLATGSWSFWRTEERRHERRGRPPEVSGRIFQVGPDWRWFGTPPGGVNGRIKGTRLGRGFQVLVRAGRHGCHRCGRSAGGRLRTRHVHSAAGRQGAAAAGGAGVHTRCGDSSPHRLGVGSGGDGAGADRGPPAFKFRQEGLGPALRGAREFGAGVATLAFPDTGRLGSVPWAARGPGAGLGRRVTPAGLGPGPGGRALASGQRRRRAAGTPSSWSGGGQRAGDVSRGSGGISRGLGLKVSGD